MDKSVTNAGRSDPLLWFIYGFGSEDADFGSVMGHEPFCMNVTSISKALALRTCFCFFSAILAVFERVSYLGHLKI